MKQVEVVALVLIKDARVFCAQRKDEGETAKKWEFPGGKIEAGESHIQALAREISEEFATRISVGSFVTTVHHQYKTFFLTMHAYTGTIQDGNMTLSEHLDSRWLTKEELNCVDWAPADLPIVEQVREILG
ncbi:MAG TPA: (deoxy)nucleoside triphosphate pyrophosphohydrolase [Treponemataceae bacterium]|nr:(deoxy)nucleoside triphosphate pyrophosphohydrolase [Treponemataceae bacterium]